jgi:hypothetical protein
MARCICVLSSKNPTHLLVEHITNIQLFYPEFDIVVVDSDSSDFTYYDLLPKHVKVDYCKNRNWELGAWYYAFKQYPDYDIYMFMQDSLIPLCRIPWLDTENFEKNTVYSFHYEAMLWHGGYYDDLVNIYRDSSLHFIAELDPNTLILGTAHSSFITDRDNAAKMLQLEEPYIEKNVQKTKVHSWLAERTGGLIPERNCNKRIDITPYFQKYSLGRDCL